MKDYELWLGSLAKMREEERSACRFNVKLMLAGLLIGVGIGLVLLGLGM